MLKILTNLIHLFGVPNRIVSDRGTAYTSQTFRMFCESYGIKYVLNAVATPRANGQCERYNKTIALATMAVERDPRDWDMVLKQVQSILNTTHNKGINTTPMKALIECETRSRAEATLLSQIRDMMHQLDLGELCAEMKTHIDQQDQQIQKERYDRARRDARKYHDGELVLVQITSDPATDSSRKHPKFKEPFRIRKVLFNDRYEVENLREGRRRSRTVVDKIKPWITIQGE